MREKALEIINNNIEMYPVIYKQNDQASIIGLNLIMGKIMLAVELQLITHPEMDAKIDAIFVEYEKLEKV